MTTAKRQPKATGLSQGALLKDGTVEKPKAKQNPFDDKLFRAAVESYVKTNGILTEENSQDDINRCVSELVEMWEIKNLADDKEKTSFGSTVAAVMDFQEYMQTIEYTYEPPVFFVVNNFNISMTMNTPSGSLTIGMQFAPTSFEYDETIRKAKDFLQGQIKKVFLSEINRDGGTQLTKTTNREVKPEYKVDDDTFVAIRANIYNGKMTYHLLPQEGKWTQYGVPIYKDIAAKIGLDLPDEEGEFEIEPTEFEYELKPDGKPRRIIG